MRSRSNGNTVKLVVCAVVLSLILFFVFSAFGLYWNGYKLISGPGFLGVIGNDSTSDMGGVRLTIKRVRKAGTTLDIVIAIEHSRNPDGPGIDFDKSYYTVTIFFWDGQGRLLGCPLTLFRPISLDFRQEKANLFEDSLNCNAPTNAQKFSVEVFPASTKRVVIPH